eukprot:612294-Ditylum_brightwellii.AAC.1
MDAGFLTSTLMHSTKIPTGILEDAFKYVLISLAYHLLSLSKVYDAAGNVCTIGLNDSLQLLNDPTNLLGTSKIHDSLCWHI